MVVVASSTSDVVGRVDHQSMLLGFGRPWVESLETLEGEKEGNM